MDENDADGGHIHGNFPNYYTFHPLEERMERIPSTVLTGAFGHCSSAHLPCILDVGCNEGVCVCVYTSCFPFAHARSAYAGDLTLALKQRTEKETSLAALVLGVDLDFKLIRRAASKSAGVEGVQFSCEDIMDDSVECIAQFLRASGRTHFDLVTCFRYCTSLCYAGTYSERRMRCSISMWIHLHHKDEGLFRFLRRLSNISQALLIEAQPWDCYKRAVQRAKRRGLGEFVHFRELRVRQDVQQMIHEYLLSAECGFEASFHMGTTKWKRDLVLYQRQTTVPIGIERNNDSEHVDESEGPPPVQMLTMQPPALEGPTRKRHKLEGHSEALLENVSTSDL
jgi:SAM-dependent methyltransferase